MKFKKTFVVTVILSCLGTAFAADNGYNFCGYKTQPADPETSNQFKSLGIKDNFTVKPEPLKLKGSEKELTKMTLSSWKTLSEYQVLPYSKNNAQGNYVNLPEIGPFMMVWSDEYKKNIPAAWVYWIGDGYTVVDGHYQPYNRVLEPINFIFVVKGFDNTNKANNYMVSKLQQAGFTKEYSDQHSSGYSGIFKGDDGKLETFKQIGGHVNDGYHGYTFEDVSSPDIGGDHFRLFGPYQDKDSGAYIYTASLSKESPRYHKNGELCGHMFESFTKAKATLALGLLDNTNAKMYETNLFTTIPDSIVKAGDNANTYFTGDQQVTNSQISNIAFVAVFDKNDNQSRN